MSQLAARDLAHIFHPCSQMKDYEQFPPIEIIKASGSYLHCADGSSLIDAISSWWCKSLGHAHPLVKKAISEQLEQFEHIIHANTTYEKIVRLSEQLCHLNPKTNKVFYAGDGSCAVEIAMKLALHAKLIQGQPERRQFIALSNGYHGETLATLAVSDLGIYKAPYEGLGVTCHYLEPIPYVDSLASPLSKDCSEYWPAIEVQLERYKDQSCAIVLEPLLQGAGGMLVYSADFLSRLALWAKKNDVYLIADEIMTGIGRTGEMLACTHAAIEPDLICLSKGLTSGTLPLSCVLLSDDVYDCFYDDYSKGTSFLHSHTYCGNPLAVSAALAVLDVVQSQNLCAQADKLGHYMLEAFQNMAEMSNKITNIRQIGAMVAGDLIQAPSARAGLEIFKQAVNRGALLRPLGNTLYWLPPLNTEFRTIDTLATITYDSIKNYYG